MSDEILMKDKITKDKKCQKFQSSSSVFLKLPLIIFGTGTYIYMYTYVCD